MKEYKPTTPSRRGMKGYDFSQLTKIEPLKSHKWGFSKSYGRNNRGRITGPRKGGGAKRLYRDVDFKKTDKLNIPGKVVALEYDPIRTSRIAKFILQTEKKIYIGSAG